MTDFQVTFNTTQLLAAADAAWGEANMVLGREFQKRITSNIWAWPRSPSPRDIVDQGQLRDSYTPTAITPTVFEHAWNTDYAMAVHEGAVYKDGAGNAVRAMPARKWVRVTLRDFKFADAYARLAQAEMERRTRGL